MCVTFKSARGGSCDWNLRQLRPPNLTFAKTVMSEGVVTSRLNRIYRIVDSGTDATNDDDAHCVSFTMNTISNTAANKTAHTTTIFLNEGPNKIASYTGAFCNNNKKRTLTTRAK